MYLAKSLAMPALVPTVAHGPMIWLPVILVVIPLTRMMLVVVFRPPLPMNMILLVPD